MTPATATRPPEAKLERHRCGACAYGISVARPLPQRCPMCGGMDWQPEPDRRGRPVR